MIAVLCNEVCGGLYRGQEQRIKKKRPRGSQPLEVCRREGLWVGVKSLAGPYNKRGWAGQARDSAQPLFCQEVPRPESIFLQFIAQKENQVDRQQLGRNSNGSYSDAPIGRERQGKGSGGCFDECPRNGFVVTRTFGEGLPLEKYDFVAAIVRGVDAGLGAGFAGAKHGSSNLALIHIPSQAERKLSWGPGRPLPATRGWGRPDTGQHSSYRVV